MVRNHTAFAILVSGDMPFASRPSEQAPHLLVIVHRDVQVHAGRDQVRVARGHPDFGQRTPASQCVRYESVASVPEQLHH
jgi:hypothetical protein